MPLLRNGALKDMFKTILNQGSVERTPPQRIVVRGDGNIIAPGGTIHMVQPQPGRRNPRSNSQ